MESKSHLVETALLLFIKRYLLVLWIWEFLNILSMLTAGIKSISILKLQQKSNDKQCTFSRIHNMRKSSMINVRKTWNTSAKMLSYVFEVFDNYEKLQGGYSFPEEFLWQCSFCWLVKIVLMLERRRAQKSDSTGFKIKLFRKESAFDEEREEKIHLTGCWYVNCLFY